MKKIYILEDLDCAHCAAKIEEAVGKLDGVQSSKCTFLTQKLNIEIDDTADINAITKSIKDIVAKLEPDVTVVAK
ncbi:MAG: heavy-metal-associated domain-containing protein [Lachnospiraceae bacterium]|nr:heavy-metal-associated domain-containing protein [Candidatus Colinaster equi]